MYGLVKYMTGQCAQVYLVEDSLALGAAHKVDISIRRVP